MNLVTARPIYMLYMADHSTTAHRLYATSHAVDEDKNASTDDRWWARTDDRSICAVEGVGI